MAVQDNFDQMVQHHDSESAAHASGRRGNDLRANVRCDYFYRVSGCGPAIPSRNRVGTRPSIDSAMFGYAEAGNRLVCY